MISLFSKRASEHDFSVWIRPFVKSLYAAAYQYTNNSHSAEDLVQEVMTDVFVKKQWRTIEKPKAWLQRCLYHRFIDQYRKHKPESAVQSLDDNALEIPTSGDHDGDIMARQLRQAIDRLPLQQRVAVTMCDINGYSLVELSVITEKPVGTIKSDLHRARKKLKTIIEMQPLSAPVRLVVER